MKYVIVTGATIMLLLIQNEFSKKSKVLYLFILPVLSLVIGFTYQTLVYQIIQFKGLYAFLIVALCLLGFGFLKRLDYRKKEMEHMKSQDL